MKWIRRFQNLWELSNYRVKDLADGKLIKTSPTIKKKLATIIKEPINIFPDEPNITE